jgi:PAS domain S-box-containing protein
MSDFHHTVPQHSTTMGRLEKPPAGEESYYRAVLDGLPAAIYTTDPSGCITYFNEAAVKLWGHRPQIGKSEWCGSWKLFWPDGRVLPHGECPMALAIKEKKLNRGMEAVAERPDGTRVPFIPYPTPLFDAQGVLIGAVNMLVDISERKQAEEVARRLAAIVESSDDAILTKDLNGIITTWNKGAERVFGYTANEIIGKSVLTLIPEDLQHEEPSILSRLRKGERIDHYETIRRHKDGTLLDISLTVSPVMGSQGKVVGASKIARDISDINRTRRQRELLLREMDHRIKNLFALASGVVSLSARSAATPKELVQTVTARLGALAKAHALTLTTPSPDKIEKFTMLHALLSTILSAHDGKTDDGRPRISIEGVDVAISGEAVTNFALLLHEFATNAAKYGALSVPNGHIEIASSETDDKVLLTWHERGGPRIDRPADHEGFGSVLARMTVTGQLGGNIERDWQPDGLCIRLSIDRARLMGAPRTT